MYGHSTPVKVVLLLATETHCVDDDASGGQSKLKSLDDNWIILMSKLKLYFKLLRKYQRCLAFLR